MIVSLERNCGSGGKETEVHSVSVRFRGNVTGRRDMMNDGIQGKRDREDTTRKNGKYIDEEGGGGGEGMRGMRKRTEDVGEQSERRMGTRRW